MRKLTVAPTVPPMSTAVRLTVAARLAESLGDADAARRSSGVHALLARTTVAEADRLAVA